MLTFSGNACRLQVKEMDVQRSYIYYNRKGRTGRRKPEVQDSVKSKILRISAERTTYGYRRIWAMLRNSGTAVNVKTVRGIVKRDNLSLPYARHKNRTRRRDLTEPDNINMLWETDIHYVSTGEGMFYLMSIKDCFSKKWISYEFSRSCMARDAICAVEKAYASRFPETVPHKLILRTDNAPQYVANAFKHSMKILGIGQEYIRKHTPEDNGNIESFHSSLKTDYVWVTDLETFEDAEKLMKYAFTDYNSIRPHSSIGYLPPDEFERRLNENENFRNDFLEKRKRKEEIRMKNREEKKKRLRENVL